MLFYEQLLITIVLCQSLLQNLCNYNMRSTKLGFWILHVFKFKKYNASVLILCKIIVRNVNFLTAYSGW
jgi:hypothetical protein